MVFITYVKGDSVESLCRFIKDTKTHRSLELSLDDPCWVCFLRSLREEKFLLLGQHSVDGVSNFRSLFQGT